MASLSAAVGQRIKALREERGVSADQVAEAARTAGLRWQRSTVASIETGRRGLSAEELLLLPLVMTTVLGSDVHLSRLLDVEAELSDEVTFRPQGLRALLAGEPTKAPTHMFMPRLAERMRNSPSSKRRRRIEELWPEVHGDVSVNFDNVFAVEKAASGEAEQKAARSLGVTALEVAAVAFRLWGRGLTAEREARVEVKVDEPTSRRSAQAIRGRITRTLLAEVQPVLAEHPDGGKG